MTCRRPSQPDAPSVSCFHEALYYGQVEFVRRLIYRNPSLANARSSSSPHPTSLMICATSRQATLKNTLTLLKLLLAKGASLQTKDDHRRTVLMAVCASGTHPNIVKCLLEWDQSISKHRVLLWSDEDDQGRTALGIASINGYGQLASFILDVLGAEEEMRTQSPLYALNMALESGDEWCVMELLRNKKLKRLVRDDRRQGKLTTHGEWNQTQSQRVEGEEEVTMTTCVTKAVEKEMVRVVKEMHRLNRSCVAHATWFTLCNKMEICGKGKVKGVPRPIRVRPEFHEIANLHRQDCTWERMKIVFLVRYAPEHAKYDMTQINIVAELPDALFRIVAKFLKPKFDDAEEAQKERFKAVLDLSSW